MYKSTTGQPVSLLELQRTPQLVLSLDQENFWQAWKDAVQLVGQIEGLCNEFEREWVRRNANREKDK